MTLELAVEISLKFLAVGVLVFLNGFFVAAEFALVKLRATQLSGLIEEGHRRAKMAEHLLSHLDAYLSAAQLGITLASLGLGWIGEPIFFTLLEPVFDGFGLDAHKHEAIRHSIAFGVGFTVITFLHIVVGEMAPKSLAIRKPLHTAIWVAYPFHWFYVTMKPFILALNHSALWLLRMAGIEADHGHDAEHSEEELRLLIESAHPNGTGVGAKRDLGREIILSAMDLRERIAREVQKPRQEIVVLDTKMPMEECLDFVTNSHYSRYPLCVEGEVDRAIGVVHIRDIISQRNTAKEAGDLAPLSRKIIYVPPTARLEKLLELFIDRKLHMAMIVDEFGGTEGLVTLENVLEELVGQIQDEFDEEQPLITQINEDTWELNGDFPLHELEELVDEEFEEEEISTTSGYFTHRLGSFPNVGDEIEIGEFRLRVLELDGPTVDKLRLEREPKAPEDPPADNK
ncbi:MAG: hemolysin family protein [Limisphaerales bacterium]